MEAVEATYDVLIVGFDPNDEPPADRLQRAFGIGAEAATQIVAKLPATVQRGVTRVRADYFTRALVLIGAHVELRDAQGALVATHAPEPEPRASQAPARGATPIAPATPSGAPFAFAHDTMRVTPQPWVDPMSRTLAAAPPVMNAHHAAAAGEPPTGSDTAYDFTPAHPTVREMVAAHPAAAVDAAARARNAPATFITAPRGGSNAPAPATTVRPSAHPTAPIARSSSIPAAPAVPNPAPWQPAPLQHAPAAAAAPPAWADPAPIGQPNDAIAWPRVPSSVFDPPPNRAQAAPRAELPPPAAPPLHALDPSANLQPPTLDPNARPFAASALEPTPILASTHNPLNSPIAVGAPPHPLDVPHKFGGGQAALDLTPHGAPVTPALNPQTPAASAGFDIAKSVVVNPLWRPPAPGAAPALTLDNDPAAALRVLAPWEQPNVQSMAEPALELPPSPRLPPRVGAPAAPATGATREQPANSARPAARRAPPARVRGPKPSAGADAGALPPAAGAVQRPAPPRPAAVGKAERGPSRHSVANVDLRSFWETVPEALLLPFQGVGIYWILAVTAWSMAAGAFLTLSHFALFVSLPFTVMVANSTLAFACDYYRVCTWAPTNPDKRIDRKPDFDPVRLFHGYMRSGLHLLLFMIISQVPAIWWLFRGGDGDEGVLGVLIDPITWLLFLLPYLYWPMGVGLTAIGNNFAAIWNVPFGVRVIARLPLEYFVIVFVGVLSFGFSLLCLLVFGQLLGVSSILGSASFGLPLAVSHGMQGALMGHLVRSNAEAFE